jgi:transcriptional regulator with GAF, ATPase, and Fis domain
MTMELTRKVALITALGRGLSRGMTLAFARQAGTAHYPASVVPEAQEPQRAELGEGGTANATATTDPALALVAALQAAQALSGQMTLDRLLETMMAPVLAHVGAQRGVFLREHDGRWLIVAQRTIDRSPVTSAAAMPIDASEEVSASIIEYVKRTGEVVCLDDARSDECFAADPYILRRQPKSIACLPIVNQATQLGLLYLENPFTAGTFTAPRLALLQFLTSQLAISLEHAQIQAALQAEIEDRKQAEAALQTALTEIAQLQTRLQAENGYRRDEIEDDYDFEGIVGHSPALLRVLQQVERVAGTDTTVLILGETGTGKELLARAIHHHSARRDRPLVKVDCAALPPTLIESELFGHEKGAFTGALTRKMGRFELADKGTLFLDEIGELPLDIQAKLLRVLQDGTFERLGSVHTTCVDVRVIAATNRDLAQQVAAGHFREDLYYRLNVFPVTLPPLRERREDIPLLVWYVIAKGQSKLGKKVERIPEQAMARLMAYHWPGNIRELANVIERAIILSPGTTLVVDEALGSGARAEPRPLAMQHLEEVERAHIVAVLEVCHWHIKGVGQAAERLGLHPSTLYSRMKKLGIARLA